MNEQFVIGKDDYGILVCDEDGKYSYADNKILKSENRIRGIIDGKVAQCLRIKNKYFPSFYYLDGLIYSDNGTDAKLMKPYCVYGEYSIYLAGNNIVLTDKRYYSIVNSKCLENNASSVKVKFLKTNDERCVLAVQGILIMGSKLNAVCNEIFLVMEEGLEEIYTSNLERFKKLVKYYKEVETISTSLSDIRQRVRNSLIKSELQRNDINVIGNSIVVGNVSFYLGGER